MLQTPGAKMQGKGKDTRKLKARSFEPVAD